MGEASAHRMRVRRCQGIVMTFHPGAGKNDRTFQAEGVAHGTEA